MKEVWIKMRVRSDGTVDECLTFDRKKATDYLLGKKERKEGDFFTVQPWDEGDALAVKRAVGMLGGADQLARDLMITPPAVYQWVKRKRIGREYREDVYSAANMPVPHEKNENRDEKND